MTISFHHTSTLLNWAKNFTPNMLMTQKTATIAMLTKIPGTVRTSTPLFRLHQPRHVARGVLDGREHLDADGSRRRQPRDPPAGVAGERTEGIVRVAHDTAGDGEHDTEFGIVECHEDDEDRAQSPRQDRGRSGHARGIEGAEEPTGADDRPDPGEE